MIEYLKTNARDLIVIALVGAAVVKVVMEIIGFEFRRGHE